MVFYDNARPGYRGRLRSTTYPGVGLTPIAEDKITNSNVERKISEPGEKPKCKLGSDVRALSKTGRLVERLSRYEQLEKDAANGSYPQTKRYVPIRLL